MWKPGKWVYVDDEPSESTTNENSNDHSDPPSPPWKLGQVPVETAIFKDGRRMSRRFNPSIKSSDAAATTTTTKFTTPPPQPIVSKKLPRKSTGQLNTGSAQTASDKNSQPRRKSHGMIKDQPSTRTLQNDSLQPAPPETDTQASDASKSPPALDLTIHETGHQERNNHNTSTTPLSPRTSTPQNVFSDLDPPPILTVQTHLGDLKAPSKSRTSLSATEDLPQSILDFNSVTEAPSAEPPTPPAIELSSASISDPRASAPPFADQQIQLPLKKFKPWEALKSFQTDGADVVGDLKLIQEGHQKRLQNNSHVRPFHHHPKRASTPSKALGLSAPTEQTIDAPRSEKNGEEQPCGAETSHPKRDDDLSSSSDLTELSSSLSDLSDEELSEKPRSSASSAVYSEMDLEDDCLPDVLVRKICRPSRAGSSANPQMTTAELIKWKKRKSAVRQHKERKAARRSLDAAAIAAAKLETENWEAPAYMKIKANIYPFRKPELSEFPPAICNCTDGGCGEKCLNRAMFYLCDPKLCQLGQACKNLPFNQRKDAIDESSARLGKGLKVFYTGPIKGWGLKTEIKLKKDQFIIDYRGEIISRDVCYKRVLNEYSGCKHFYLMDYDGSDVIDAGLKGNCSRFINHSCTPNLRVERFKLSGLEEYQFGIFTLRDIEIGEELSYDYGWRNFSDIAPTSNVRTSIHSKPLSQPQVEAAAGGMSTSAGRRAPSTRRAARTGPADTVVTATAPTVQRCYCGTKGCKGFLGAKKLPLPANPVSLPPIPPASSSSLNPSLKRKKKP
ncbi:hypothetical protein PCANC_05721 [Puccinia coronata f. sp. avenae]|uniref:Histone-lysine N-methyltransferase n=1 Tax=Puccinia coronata f. sp. avenae TaxID=200324 RepID=A0A2N5TDK0_9BASI|nr:hypothetical protein PCASD_09099 [Puccinia coronata f. sp. avenae]PLW52894.1 hypothetical protein PCANC_05721 [Puccinia coronata f. sp. avenae]